MLPNLETELGRISRFGSLSPETHVKHLRVLQPSRYFCILKKAGWQPVETTLDFAKVMKIVADFFERCGFAYAAVGAFGLHAYGLTRATSDLDFVTELRAQADLVRFLEHLGYETIYISSGYSNHLHADPALGRLDFVYVSGETSRQLLGSAKRLLVLGDISVPVPRAEHLAAMKIHAMKNDPERTFQEMADILFLLRLPEVDEEEIREYFEKQGLAEKYNEIRQILNTARPEP